MVIICGVLSLSAAQALNMFCMHQMASGNIVVGSETYDGGLLLLIN